MASLTAQEHNAFVRSKLLEAIAADRALEHGDTQLSLETLEQSQATGRAAQLYIQVISAMGDMLSAGYELDSDIFSVYPSRALPAVLATVLRDRVEAMVGLRQPHPSPPALVAAVQAVVDGKVQLSIPGEIRSPLT